MRNAAICLSACIVLALTVLGCTSQEQVLSLEFLRVEEDETVLWGRVEIRPDVPDEVRILGPRPYTYIVNSPQSPGPKRGAFAYISGGNVYLSTQCGVEEAITTSGEAGMVTLSGVGGGNFSYLDQGKAVVANRLSNCQLARTDLGPAEAVHISPDGQRLLLARRDANFQLQLQLCSAAGDGCTTVEPPEGGDITTATFAPGGEHLAFRVPLDARMQVVVTGLDGAGARQLTHLTDGDVVFLYPYEHWLALTIRYSDTDSRIATVDMFEGFTQRVEGGWNTFALDASP